MHTSLTLHRARSRETLWLFVAFLLVFALGSASGFVVRATIAPSVVSTPRVAKAPLAAPCPSGSHVVVWYTAHAWGCVSDTNPVGQK